jgi:hypothetical protein
MSKRKLLHPLELLALIVATLILAVVARGQGLFDKKAAVKAAVKDAATKPVNDPKTGPLVLEVEPDKGIIVETVPAKGTFKLPSNVVKVPDYMMRPETGNVEGQRYSFIIRAEPGSTIWQTSYQWEKDDPQHKQELEGEPGAVWLKLPWTVPDSGEIVLFTPPPPWKPVTNLARLHTHFAVEYPDTGGWNKVRVTFNRNQRNVMVDLRRGK